MKCFRFLPLLALLAIPYVHAQNVAEFDDADKDKDGALSIEEAMTALPDAAIMDSDSDGKVNKTEAANAIEGYALAEDDQQPDALVTEADYQLIVQALEKSAVRRSVSRSN